MKLSLSDSPTKLAVLAALGGPIAYALPLLLGPLNHSWLFGPWLLFGIVVAPVCTILPFKFVTDLRHGVEDERWTEAQLEPLRTLLQSRYYTALSVGLFVAFAIFEFALKQRSPGLGWAYLFFLEMILSQLHFALKRPPSAIPPNEWSNSSPIDSDQWGQH
jgi:hypothetical protein